MQISLRGVYDLGRRGIGRILDFITPSNSLETRVDEEAEPSLGKRIGYWVLASSLLLSATFAATTAFAEPVSENKPKTTNQKTMRR